VWTLSLAIYLSCPLSLSASYSVWQRMLIVYIKWSRILSPAVYFPKINYIASHEILDSPQLINYANQVFKFLPFSVKQCLLAISDVGIRSLNPWIDIMGGSRTVGYVLLDCLSDFGQMIELRTPSKNCPILTIVILWHHEEIWHQSIIKLPSSP
jgi:hypothetical protein